MYIISPAIKSPRKYPNHSSVFAHLVWGSRFSIRTFTILSYVNHAKSSGGDEQTIPITVIIILMNLSKGGYSIIQKLKLDTLIGRVVMDPRQSDYIDIGILFNLTAVIYTTLMMKAIRVPLSMILEIGMYGLK